MAVRSIFFVPCLVYPKNPVLPVSNPQWDAPSQRQSLGWPPNIWSMSPAPSGPSCSPVPHTGL